MRAPMTEAGRWASKRGRLLPSLLVSALLIQQASAQSSRRYELSDVAAGTSWSSETDAERKGCQAARVEARQETVPAFSPTACRPPRWADCDCETKRIGGNGQYYAICTVYYSIDCAE
jgi:hypothetical protein